MIECTLCKKQEAFYKRQFSGEKLCSNCFINSIKKKVRRTIGKYKMFELNDKIAVAISGGKDSLSLLHILTKIEENFPKSEIQAITIDEGIKNYRDEAINLASKICSKLKVKLTVKSFKEIYGWTMDEIVKKTSNLKETPCSFCGMLRRRALNIVARDIGATKIATGHNLDDVIQTFILNIFHGGTFRIPRSGPISYGKIGFIPRVKPLYRIPEKEIVLYSYFKKISYQYLPCPYAGRALRNDVRNVIDRLEIKHPGIKYTLFNSMEKIRKNMRINLLTNKKKIELKNCLICGELTSSKTCIICQFLNSISNK